MFKSFVIALLITVGFIWNSSAESSEPKDRSFIVDAGLKFRVYQVEEYRLANYTKQTPGKLQVPEAKDVVISLEELDKTNIDAYISAINKNKLYELDAYIAATIECLPELSERCPAIKNLTLGVFIEDKKMPDLSAFKKLSHLRVIIGSQQKRKVIKSGYLLLRVVTKAEQDYINELISYVGKLNNIEELSVSASYLDINLSSYSKQQHINCLSILAGRLTLPDDPGIVNSLSFSCLVLNDFPDKINSFRNLSNLKFDITTLPPVLVFPEMTNLEFLDISWNLFSGVKLNNMPKLKTIKMENCSNLTQLSGLEGVKNLQALALFDAVKLENTAALKELKNLKSLDLSYCKKINSLDFLSEMHLLKDLKLAGCLQVKDYSVISKLSTLETLNIAGCKTNSYDFLSKLPALKELFISASLDEVEVNKIKEKVSSNCKITPEFLLEFPF